MGTTRVTRLGDYELWAQIGTGAVGSVWKAYHRGPVPQVVAVKRLRATSGDGEDLARIRREATILTELDHPHIVRLVEVLEDGAALALAMQLAAGGSLEALLAERGQLAPGEVVAVAAPIADALWSAHRRGIIHGDVKPANILFTVDGEPLLADFDVARSLGRVGGEQLAGTAAYLAPELLDRAGPDQRSDIYSLAVVCHEALFGYLPCTGAVPVAGVGWAAADRPTRARTSDLSGPLATVVERAMARDPDHRFPTAGAFARALRDALPHEAIALPGIAATSAPADGESARPTLTFGPQPPRAGTKRRRWLARAVTLVPRVVAAAVRRVLRALRARFRPERRQNG